MDSISPKRNLKIALQNKITRKEAEKAVETLIRWAGDDPEREGLKDTPKRVVSAYEEFFFRVQTISRRFSFQNF